MTSKDPIEIRKPPTFLYYLAGIVLLFILGFGVYYFGYDKYLQEQFRQENQNLNLFTAPTNLNQNQAASAQKIYIDSPREDEVIGNPVTIKGRAEIKGTLTVRVRDANGKILGETTALVEDEARRSDPTNYQTNLSYATSTTEFGLVEVFDYLAKDGSIQDLVSVKIKFANFGQTDETADWQTYRNENLGIEFKYPQDWILNESKDKIQDKKDKLIISISTGNSAVLGISYCDAYPGDKRCETVRIDNTHALMIDWGNWNSPEGGNAFASTQLNGERVLFITFHRTNTSTKEIFNQILSTFKFIE